MRFPSRAFLSHGFGFGLAIAIPLSATGDEDFTYFPDVDTNQNGAISSNEFSAYARSAGAFDDWDVDNDGVLGPDEWDLQYDYLYSEWDLDGNGYIDSSEFYLGAFRHFDTDQNGYLDQDEWDVAADGAIFRK